MATNRKDKPPLPTGWLERGAKIASQTSRSAARFMGSRVKAFAAPSKREEILSGFHAKTAQQVVDMLGEMKGAAMKLGQLASFYEFAAPGEHLATYRDALTMLQNSAPPMDPAASVAVIEEEFGKPLGEVFVTFEEEPVAAASIGQVHRGTLPNGDVVAIKVQYPGVAEAVRADLKNVSALAKMSVAIAPNVDPRAIAGEVKDRVLEELDYSREAANQQRFAELFDGHPFIVVPRVHLDYCRTRVLTQEFIDGEPFPNAFDRSQEERDRIGETLFRFFYGSLNRFLLFSADPHPGNYLLLPDAKVAFLDFGLVRAVEPATLKSLVEIVIALIREDKRLGRRALEGVGILDHRTPEVDAVWEHIKMINRPVLTDREFTIDRPLVQEVAAAGFDMRSKAFQTMRKVNVPPIMVTFNRMSFGVASLLARLEATANWQRIAREMWGGEPSQTELGTQEQKWVAERYPDLKPPIDF